MLSLTFAVGLEEGVRVVGLDVGFRVAFTFCSFRDTLKLASSSPLFFSSPPVRKTRSLVSVVEDADTHPSCGCQVHPAVPARHELFSVKDVQPSTV